MVEYRLKPMLLFRPAPVIETDIGQVGKTDPVIIRIIGIFIQQAMVTGDVIHRDKDAGFNGKAPVLIPAEDDLVSDVHRRKINLCRPAGQIKIKKGITRVINRISFFIAKTHRHRKGCEGCKGTENR